MGKRKPQPIEFWLCYAENQPKAQTFIRVTSDLLNCSEFTSLSFSAQILYIRMCAAAKGQPEFIYPYSYFKGKMSKQCFQDAKTELLEHGFITVIQQGKNTRTPCVYKFSSEWKRH